LREIPLTKGYVALIDDEDYERVSMHKWCAFETGVKIKRVYGVRKTPGSRRTNRLNIFLHRFVMDAPSGIHVDHEDRNGLNCQKYNLRIATPAQNGANSQKIIGVSGYRGVEPYPNGRWRCRAQERHIGVFDTPEAAAQRYDEVAIEIWGEFAMLNFPNNVGGVIRPRSSKGKEQCHSM
jgi:hypothetical protein